MSEHQPFPSYEAALDWLYGTQLFGIKVGLETTRKLVEALGAWPGEDVLVYHVAGTNGKGSVCAFIDRLCRARGLRTGLYTSPHLVDFTERFRIDGNAMPRETAVELLAQVRTLVEGWDPHPTFFEIVTAMALAWFKREGVEAIVLETGMGGRLDSTNVVRPTTSLITKIDLDHQKWLGDTLGEIAAEKAGIIKRGVPVYTLPQAPEVMEVLVDTARRAGSDLTVISEPYDGPVGLAGSHQPLHAAMAVELFYGHHHDALPEEQARALRETQLDGRFQALDAEGKPVALPQARFILDGAHNPAAAARLAKTWREVYGDERATLVCGVLSDKDADDIVRELGVIANQVIPAPIGSPRAFTPEEMAWTIQRYAPGKLAPESAWKGAANVGELLERLEGGRVLVAGSLYLVGETLAYLRGSGPIRKTSQ